MTIEEFWEIVERVHATAPVDMPAKCRALEAELRKLSYAEFMSFGDHLGDCYYRLYTWDVWGAAFVIRSGCGDDQFMDFRATLISLGRAPYETALSDADSLADFNIGQEWAAYEGYQYVPGKVYQELHINEPQPESEGKKHPQEPAGVPFESWDAAKRFPRLAVKYDFKDSDWENERVLHEKEQEKISKGEIIKRILLESGVVHSSGLIPPMAVVAEVLRSGRAPAATGLNYTFEPMEINHIRYWSAVILLESSQPEELEVRPDLKGVKLKGDTESSGAKEFDEWMEALRKRGLA